MTSAEKIGRNDPCPCGSGLKFKRCCETKRQQRRSRVMLVVVVGVAIGALLIGIASFTSERAPARPRRVWSPEHGHYHTVQ